VHQAKVRSLQARELDGTYIAREEHELPQVDGLAANKAARRRFRAVQETSQDSLVEYHEPSEKQLHSGD